MEFKDNIQRQEYIDNYLLRRLSQKEHDEFKEQLKLDNELVNDVEIQRLFIKELQKRKKFLDIVVMAEKKIQSKRKVTSYLRYSIAASFFILLSLAIWQPTFKSSNAIFIEYLDNPEVTTHITRGASSSVFYIPLEIFSENEQELIVNATQDFKNENYKLVVEKLTKVDQIIQRSSSAGLMLAVSEINTEDLKNAKKILTTLSLSSDKQIMQASRYYFGLVLATEGKTLKARRIFRKLSNQTGEYSEKAKEILKEMRYF
jgi:hypothetical protein